MRSSGLRTIMTILVLLALAASLNTPAGAMTARPDQRGRSAVRDSSPAVAMRTATPIKHLVVIYQENVSFDHYFATYPHAANLPGEPRFAAPYPTPRINGLSARLLTHNPNMRQPFRLARKQALTCGMNHDYMAEQRAYNGGRMDQFVQWTEGWQGDPARYWNWQVNPPRAWQYCPWGVVMGYYDGNTVTALWNYALHFAMDDNAHGTTFGPSTVGALNLVAGDTSGAVCAPYALQFGIHTCSWKLTPRQRLDKNVRPIAIHDDIDPYYDDCSVGGPHNKSRTAALTTRNIGDLLTAAHITWGWFAAGFANCLATHPAVAYDVQIARINPATDGRVSYDYDPHQEPFQYFATTSNPHHKWPSSVAMIGRTDRANHQYNLKDFWQAAESGNLPAVSFLKAPSYQTGHPGYSDPLDEQAFLVSTINRLEQLPSWRETAIIITYDDSDGWYDHVPGKIVNHSATQFDFHCGSRSDAVPWRCGYGPRIPYLVISPYARTNVVDHALIDQSSTLRFIEDNWLGGVRLSRESFDNRAGSIAGMFNFGRPPAGRLFLDPRTGAVINARGHAP
jgi:phospholipase C